MKNARRVIGGLLFAVTLVLVGYPLFVTSYYLIADSGLRGATPSKFAYSLHRSVSKNLPDYVDERIASGVARTLSSSQITATESPVYGAFFYLLATANLQAVWEGDRSLSNVSPAESGKEAVDASLRIMLDDGHAHWVKEYWGEDYMTDPNCFYRMLMVGSITAHHEITGETGYLDLLRKTVDDLAADIDASPHGLIDDYPGQCFPCDVTVAIAMILRADRALGTDRSEWARGALRRMMDNFGDELPPYTADATTGLPILASRGCTNGFFFSYAREIDPELADKLYTKFVADFWQEKYGAAGWREFPKWAEVPDYYMDPDSGPVVEGFGTGATGLGLGVARAQGDHDRAGKLGAETLVTAIPMPNGRLLVPWLVSDRIHAPYFAEITILHQLSILPEDGSKNLPRATMPPIMWVLLVFELLVFVVLCRWSWRLAFRKSSVLKRSK